MRINEELNARLRSIKDVGNAQDTWGRTHTWAVDALWRHVGPTALSSSENRNAVMPDPMVVVTNEGGIRFEWDTPTWRLSMEFMHERNLTGIAQVYGAKKDGSMTFQGRWTDTNYPRLQAVRDIIAEYAETQPEAQGEELDELDVKPWLKEEHEGL